MTAAPQRPTPAAADPAAIEAALWARTGFVQRHETHGSVVFLAGDRAYKLRKPVHFDFADLRDPAYRRQLAETERERAEALAPGLVIGSLDVVPSGNEGGVDLVPAGAPDAIDVVVELRRYEVRNTLLHLVTTGVAGEAECRAVGRRLARFHRDARRVLEPVDARAMVNRNLEGVLPLLGDLLAAREQFALQRTIDAFLVAWSDHLSARAAAGLVVDGHGDLRAEHVLIEEGVVQVVDRLEFPELRIVDVADELAFLLMELMELTGDESLGEAVLDGYRDGGGVAPPHALLAFFGVHRALVRAKVALLRAGQVSGDAADDATARAFHLVSIARRLAWRSRGRPIVLVTGPPAAGKSSLAEALAGAGHVPVLASDHLRVAEGRTTSPDYSVAGRARIYADLGARAGAVESCVVDATFGEEAFQQAFLTALPSDRRADLVVVTCHAPLDERRERARRRAEAGISASDAGPEVVDRLGPGEARTMLPFAERIAIDTQMPLPGQVDLVESWLDARLAASGE